ncbi:hypothetical protein [Rhodanobacter ginsengiterrae]|uniref:hypothetical protein n=1 Tax=Rhodanobacter ginsengiterrae TaxID=2008451 RepID=UPI003CF336BF
MTVALRQVINLTQVRKRVDSGACHQVPTTSFEYMGGQASIRLCAWRGRQPIIAADAGALAKIAFQALAARARAMAPAPPPKRMGVVARSSSDTIDHHSFGPRLRVSLVPFWPRPELGCSVRPGEFRLHGKPMKAAGNQQSERPRS